MQQPTSKATKTALTTAFLYGCQSALPIALGYIPVAIAFGMAAAAADLPVWAIFAMSFFIYAGASQFLLFASMMSGVHVLAIIGLCALLDSRHLLYAPLMKRHLKRSDGIIWVAPFITDEVFATAMTKLQTIEHQKPWLFGLALVSWVSWWGGTLIGVMSGQIFSAFPTMSAVMNFAFVALFASLSTQIFLNEPRFRLALVASGLAALVCYVYGYGEIALLIASFFGVLVQITLSKLLNQLTGNR